MVRMVLGVLLLVDISIEYKKGRHETWILIVMHKSNFLAIY